MLYTKWVSLLIMMQLLIGSTLLGQSTPFILNNKDFKITFPAEPVKSEEKVDTELGEINMNMHILESENEADSVFAFMIMHTLYPEEYIHSNKKDMLDAFFEGAINGGANNVQGKLLSQKTISINGFPGRDALVEFPVDENTKAIIRMVIYLVENQMIMIQTVTPIGAHNNKNVMAFHQSFQLKKTAPAAVTNQP